MAPEASGEPGDGRGGAAQKPRDLAVGGAVDESGGDWDDEIGPFQEVAECEGLLGEGPPAEGAAIALNPASILADKGAEALVTEAARVEDAMLRAATAGTETGREAALDLERLNRPVHEVAEGKGCAAGKRLEFPRKVRFRTGSDRPPDTPPVRRRTNAGANIVCTTMVSP